MSQFLLADRTAHIHAIGTILSSVYLSIQPVHL